MANFGDILSSVTLGSRQSVRRNFEDTAFEAYETDNSLEFKVFNNTGSTLTKGTVVYVNGVQGDKPTVAKADADSEGTSSKVIGLVQKDIPNMEEGLVLESGLLFGSDGDEFNTNSFNNGDLLWLSQTAGQFTATRPTQPAHGVFIGYVTRKHPNAGAVLVNIINGFEVDELHDVLITTPSNNDVLTWESSSSLWKNKPVSGGSKTLARFFADASASDESVGVYSHSVPGGTMATNGDILRGEYSGTLSIIGDANPGASVAVEFADTFFGDIGSNTMDDGDWNVRFTITRVSSSSARISVVTTFVGASGYTVIASYDSRTTGIDWTGAEAVNLFLQANEFATITATMGYLEYVGQ